MIHERDHDGPIAPEKAREVDALALLVQKREVGRDRGAERLLDADLARQPVRERALPLLPVERRELGGQGRLRRGRLHSPVHRRQQGDGGREGEQEAAERHV